MFLITLDQRYFAWQLLWNPLVLFTFGHVYPTIRYLWPNFSTIGRDIASKSDLEKSMVCPFL